MSLYLRGSLVSNLPVEIKDIINVPLYSIGIKDNIKRVQFICRKYINYMNKLIFSNNNAGIL